MKKFYIYTYLDPTKPGNFSYNNIDFEFEPFYIGKGCNYRAFMHMVNALKSRKKNKGSFLEKVQNLIENKHLPIIKVILWELEEDEAFKEEKALINCIGRIDNKTGPLLNLNNGGKGNDRGAKRHPIRVYDREGEFLKDYPSMTTASQELGITIPSIQRICNGARSGSRMPYQFRLVESGIISLPPVQKTIRKKKIKKQEICQ